MKHAIKRHWPDKEQAIIDLMNGTADPEHYDSVARWIRQCYHRPSDAEQVMCALNEVIEGHGVEAIRHRTLWIDNFHGDIVASYVNQGDTYAMTIILDHVSGKYHVTDLGTYLEE